MTTQVTQDLYDALVKIRELVQRRQLPITHEVYEVADAAIQLATPLMTDASEADEAWAHRYRGKDEE